MNLNTKKKILITGGLGYLGGRITRKLVNSGEYDVVVCTRKNNSKNESSFFGASIFEIDFNSPQNLEQATKKVHTIIHLAAPNEIDASNNPSQTLLDVSFNCLNLLTAAENNNVNKFIYFSTAHVYGAPLQGSITEQSLPLPVHSYAIAHHTAENFVRAFSLKNKITTSILRLSNSFGAPVAKDITRWSLLVNDLCKQAVVNKELVLMNSGSQLRDFIPITDVENCVLHFLNLENKILNGQCFNLGGKRTLSVLDMANLISQRCEFLFKYKPEIKINSNQSYVNGDVLNYDISKLEATGFSLLADFNQEIDGVLNFCKSNFF